MNSTPRRATNSAPNPWDTPESAAGTAPREGWARLIRRGAWLGCKTAFVLAVTYALGFGIFAGRDAGTALMMALLALMWGVPPSLVVGTIAGALIGVAVGASRMTSRGGGLAGATVAAVILLPPSVLLWSNVKALEFWLMWGVPAVIAAIALRWVGAGLATYDRARRA